MDKITSYINVVVLCLAFFNFSRGFSVNMIKKKIGSEKLHLILMAETIILISWYVNRIAHSLDYEYTWVRITSIILSVLFYVSSIKTLK